MLTVQEIIQLKEAGFTADEIAMFSEPKQPVEPNPADGDEPPVVQPKETDVWEEINQAIYHK